MSRRTELLEFAVLGLLHESPMHGYELRKRLNAALGAFRALSYGTLYPCLKSLTQQRLIASSSAVAAPGARARIVYELTADGKEHFQTLVSRADASTYDDDTFDVRLAFFARTEAQVRLRILEGRRSTLEDRLANVRTASAKNRERLDAWTTALQRHGEEQTEREVRWLNELIDAERQLRPGTAAHRGPLTDPSHPAYAPRTTPSTTPSSTPPKK